MSIGRIPPTLIQNSFLFLICGCLDFKYVSTEMTENLEPAWDENLPTVFMNFKFYIVGGSEECYFQYVNPGGTLYVGYEVISGGDGQAALVVKNPKGEIANASEWKPNGSFNEEQSMGGYYSICMDNQLSKFGEEPKLVSIYLTVIRYIWWHKYSKEISELHGNLDNFNSSVQTVERNIIDMIQYLHHTRGREAWDLNLLSSNNSYVVRRSLIQIVVVVITTAIQVYFVRKLFDTKHGGGFSNPRI